MVRQSSNEHLLQRILGSMAIHVVVVNRRGRVIYTSRTWPESEAVPSALRGVALGVDYVTLLARRASEGCAQALSAYSGMLSVLERRSRAFSHEYPCDSSAAARWYQMRVDPMPVRHGGAVICHMEVTDRVVARQRLQESLERYELATLSGRIALWDWDVPTGSMRVDPALKRLLGFQADEIADRIEAWRARVHPDDRELYASVMEAHVRGESKAIELEHRKLDANGNARWFLSRGGLRRAANGPLRVLGLDTEITERIEAERALFHETRRYQDIFASAGVAILEADYSSVLRLIRKLSGEGVTDLRSHLMRHRDLLRNALFSITLIDANPQAVRLAGVASRRELLARVPFGISESLDGAEHHLLEQIIALAEGRTEYTAELSLRTLGGAVRDVVFTTRFPVPVGAEQTALLCAHDVTELVAFRRRQEMASAAGAVSVFEYELASGTLKADGNLSALGNIPDGEDWLRHIHQADVQRVVAHQRAILAGDGGRKGNTPWGPLEFRVRQLDGGLRWLLQRGTLVRAIDGTPLRVIGTLTDITALKRGQAALRRAHRQIRDLTARLVAAQEAERRSFARELHDDVNQRLAGAGIALTNLQLNLGGASPQVRERVAELQTEIRELIIGIRRISHGLHPGVLEHAGLEAALRSLCHEFGPAHGLDINVDIYDLEEPLPRHLALCCYRVVQEALHNVAKHANARSCTVRLYQEGAALLLSVRDYGVGLASLHSRESSTQFDLLGIRGRVRLLGGRLRVASRSGRGTEVRAIIPISAGQPA
jgi:PAS domain S-box-containing protein